MENTNYKLPNFPNILTDEDIAQTFWGSQNPGLLAEALMQTVVKLKELNKSIIEYERKRVKAELRYKHKFREAYLSQEQNRTEYWKKTNAELACEADEIKMLYYQEVCSELSRKVKEIRDEIDVLKTLSFNYRQEMKL